MAANSDGINDIHWLMDILQNIDVGLVVLDRNYDVQLWNAFMEGHSGLSPQRAKGENLFSLFPDIDESWFRQKAEPVFQLKTRTFTIWEQRPYLFHFRNSRPITGRSEFMYQNTSIIPLESVNRQADHICVIIYDVTDTAVGKLDVSRANETLSQIQTRDSLTGLLNKSSWLPVLEDYFQSQQPGCLLLMDMDHFRDLNHSIGHQQCDELLRRIGQGLKSLSADNYAARFGGEIFSVILDNHDAAGSMELAEKLRRSVLNLGRNSQHDISASIGVAERSDQNGSAMEWLSNADKALYHAKESGRNRTSLFKN
jgi:diguanylate cyclase (GGDEF)-like protein